jgi:zinc transport system substrate-binding protein
VKGRAQLRIGLSFAIVFAISFSGAVPVCPGFQDNANKTIGVFVSILPQAYFVERVGGKGVDVSVMVGPGQSPATYEPVPKQMAALSKADLYFRIGVPFEDVWIERIRKSNPKMKVIDTRRGIVLLPMKGHDHGEGGNQVGPPEPRDRSGLKDPHVWLSLRRVKTMAQNMCDALIAENPSQRSYYTENLRAFHHDLDALDAEITKTMKNVETRRFMAFHPAWGYFAHDYGLEQIPIEIEGKEPSAKALSHLIEAAKQNGIKIVFVQKQFSKTGAETVARAIGGRVIPIDPLAKDYLANMRKIAETFSEVLQ